MCDKVLIFAVVDMSVGRVVYTSDCFASCTRVIRSLLGSSLHNIWDDKNVYQIVKFVPSVP